MTTRPERGRRLRARVLAAALGAALWVPAMAWALELGDLMAQLAQVRSGEARFSEQRQVQGLDAPLVSRGTLSFTAPDRFTRNTLEPRPESMSVEGNIVTLQRNGRSRSMVLDAAPEIEALVEAVRGTLTGNAQTLTQHFKVSVGGSLEQWSMDLVPVEPRLQALMSSVRITGRRAQMSTMDMRMANGDRSLMSIEPVASRTSGPLAPAAAASPVAR